MTLEQVIRELHRIRDHFRRNACRKVDSMVRGYNVVSAGDVDIGTVQSMFCEIRKSLKGVHLHCLYNPEDEDVAYWVVTKRPLSKKDQDKLMSLFFIANDYVANMCLQWREIAEDNRGLVTKKMKEFVKRSRVDLDGLCNDKIPLFS